MHDATPLTLAGGPAIVPIFIPNAGTNTPHYDCPFDDFQNVIASAADPAYVK
jgi:hypothetical protein